MSLYQYGSSPTNEIPDGTKYLGCYADARFERALSLKLTSSDDMTHQVRSKDKREQHARWGSHVAKKP